MNTLSLFNPRITSSILDAMDNGMVDLFPSLTNGVYGETTMRAPSVDVKETKAAYVMQMDLPGLTDKEVEINLKDRILSVSSAKEEKKEEKSDGTYLIRERRSTKFMRRFTLPDDIDSEAVSAAFKNGVLTVTIPRRAQASARTIAITSDNT